MTRIKLDQSRLWFHLKRKKLLDCKINGIPEFSAFSTALIIRGVQWSEKHKIINSES